MGYRLMNKNTTIKNLYKINITLVLSVFIVAFFIGLVNNAVLFVIYFAAAIVITPLMLIFLMLNILCIIKYDNKVLYICMGAFSIVWIIIGIYEALNMTLP